MLANFMKFTNVNNEIQEGRKAMSHIHQKLSWCLPAREERWGGKMTKLLKACIAQTDDLNLNHGSHVVEEKNLLWDVLCAVIVLL